MERTAAANLINSTFAHEFNRDQFTNFIRNLLKKFEEKQLPGGRARTGIYIYEPYRDLVESLDRIGKYIDADGRSLEILVVRLKPGQPIDRSRTKQRNYVAYYLENGRDDGSLRDAALVAFVEAGGCSWRFSLVRMEYELKQTESGRTKTEKTLSPARRFSFLVGEGENTHTARARFVPLLENDSKSPNLDDLSAAFSVEAITTEFFDRYRDLIGRVELHMTSIAKKDKRVRDELEKCDIQPIEFAKKLLGQIVFLYFIQKKGWLGVQKDDHWGTGPRNFLRRLFDGEVIKYNNFFNDVLEYLFYDMLAQDKGELGWRSQFKCRIPFLNGGLFEPIYGYDWENTEITLPNDLFSNRRHETDFNPGDGILDVFDRYNFTVKEDEPLEKEVAIDPELLGKVFENLLEDKDRKSKGSYYTPREVVHYMCQESIISYLCSNLNGVPREDIAGFIKYGEANIYNDARVAKEGRETDTYSYKTPQSIRSQANEIDRLLAEIKICDPAVGSGAFPMGVINEIVRARWSLTPLISPGRIDGVHGRSQYDFKWHAIENSIYGVDLDPGAVEISKLRLWLSLVVDEESLDKIQPLPNLDFKIMQGNSLLDEFRGKKLFNEKLFGFKDPIENEREKLNKKLSELQRAYATLSREDPSKLKKSDLPARIEEVALKLKKLRKPVAEKATGTQDLFQQKTNAAIKLEELHSLHQRFFKAWHKTEKEKLRRRIDESEWELIEASLREHNNLEAIDDLRKARATHTKPFFLWKLHFHDVFDAKEGFDIVLANPPYVRQEKLSSDDQESFTRNFPEVHKGTADILVYFYALAIRLLHEGGVLAFITSNKYMRASYGDKIRKHLGQKVKIKEVIDFADLPVFEVTAYPAVLLGTKSEDSLENKCSVVDLSRPITARIQARGGSISAREVREELRNLEPLIASHGIHDFPQDLLRSEGWVLENPKLLSIFARLQSIGTPLMKFVKGQMSTGVKTALNEAFVVDDETRDALIQADNNCREIIKPWLRGKDIRRWLPVRSGLYLLAVQNSGDSDCKHTWKGASTEKEAAKIFQRTYPSVYAHLMNFEDYPDPNDPKKRIGLRHRSDQGKFFWELRSCAFYSEFAKQKLLWSDIAPSPRFAIDSSGAFCDMTLFLSPNAPLWLCGILNSDIAFLLFSLLSPSIRGGYLRFKIAYIENFPVVTPNEKDKQLMNDIVSQMLAGQIDHNVGNRQINALSRQIFGLSTKEESYLDRWLSSHRTNLESDLSNIDEEPTTQRD